ncbi:hypothetical protein AK830_g11902 [Neonectria ditissima]|uniref:Clr5 domain-containing protein n=1 Tax=Neonectria ditissima TaxID=78410 RepID=A0A0P7B076_9HYPO|nr:hypothetical protein AK830_g11902 [Neonectria ditissima]
MLSDLPAAANSKRQYGYRFEKWKMRKYNSADKTSSPRNPAKIDEFPNEEIVNEFFDSLSRGIHTHGYESHSSFLNIPGVGGNYNHVAHHAQSKASATSAASDLDADASFIDEDTDSEDAVSPRPGTPIPSIRYPWETDDEAMKHVADFCAAMSDDKNAFGLYYNLFDSLSNSTESSAAAKNLLITSFTRVAQQPKNAKMARNLLARHRDQVRHTGFDHPFLFSMLDVSMEEQEGKQEQEEKLAQDTIRRRICDNIRQVLVNDTTLDDIPHTYSAIDLVTYHFLYSGLEVYEKTPSTADGRSPTLSLEDLLYQYVYKQPFYETIRDGESSPLRICSTWCARQLKINHKIPPEVASIPRDHSQRQWSDNVQLFCTLWHVMLISVQNGTPPPWYAPCESALGISPSELLVTVCWMLGAEASAPDASNDILQRADAVAKSMARLSEPQLWIKFLERFTWMNKLVDPNNDDRAFEAVILQHTRHYISATLNVELPFPADEPHAPSLDLFGEFESFPDSPEYGSNPLLDKFGPLRAIEL